jgi:hypothetical protein
LSSLATAAGPPSAARGVFGHGLRTGLVLVAGGLVFGLLAGELVASGHSAEVLALSAVLIPIAIWNRPQLGPVVLLSASVLVQQVVETDVTVTEAGVGIVRPAPPPPITSHIPLFQGIGSFHLEPADLVLLMVAIIYLARTDASTRCWPRTHVARAVGALLGCVVLGIFIGMTHHGSLREALMEARPYVYLSSAYLLTAVLVRTHSAMRTVLWAFVIATSLRALQGIYVFIRVIGWKPRPEAILGHEDAYIFGVYILMVAALWLFGARGGLPQRPAPAALCADQRRAAGAWFGNRHGAARGKPHHGKRPRRTGRDGGRRSGQRRLCPQR